MEQYSQKDIVASALVAVTLSPRTEVGAYTRLRENLIQSIQEQPAFTETLVKLSGKLSEAHNSDESVLTTALMLLADQKQRQQYSADGLIDTLFERALIESDLEKQKHLKHVLEKLCLSSFPFDSQGKLIYESSEATAEEKIEQASDQTVTTQESVSTRPSESTGYPVLKITVSYQDDDGQIKKEDLLFSNRPAGLEMRGKAVIDTLEQAQRQSLSVPEVLSKSLLDILRDSPIAKRQNIAGTLSPIDRMDAIVDGNAHCCHQIEEQRLRLDHKDLEVLLQQINADITENNQNTDQNRPLLTMAELQNIPLTTKTITNHDNFAPGALKLCLDNIYQREKFYDVLMAYHQAIETSLLLSQEEKRDMIHPTHAAILRQLWILSQNSEEQQLTVSEIASILPLLIAHKGQYDITTLTQNSIKNFARVFALCEIDTSARTYSAVALYAQDNRLERLSDEQIQSDYAFIKNQQAVFDLIADFNQFIEQYATSRNESFNSAAQQRLKKSQQDLEQAQRDYIEHQNIETLRASIESLYHDVKKEVALQREYHNYRGWQWLEDFWRSFKKYFWFEQYPSLAAKTTALLKNIADRSAAISPAQPAAGQIMTASQISDVILGITPSPYPTLSQSEQELRSKLKQQMRDFSSEERSFSLLCAYDFLTEGFFDKQKAWEGLRDTVCEAGQSDNFDILSRLKRRDILSISFEEKEGTMRLVLRYQQENGDPSELELSARASGSGEIRGEILRRILQTGLNDKTDANQDDLIKDIILSSDEYRCLTENLCFKTLVGLMDEQRFRSLVQITETEKDNSLLAQIRAVQQAGGDTQQSLEKAALPYYGYNPQERAHIIGLFKHLYDLTIKEDFRLEERERQEIMHQAVNLGLFDVTAPIEQAQFLMTAITQYVALHSNKPDYQQTAQHDLQIISRLVDLEKYFASDDPNLQKFVQYREDFIVTRSIERLSRNMAALMMPHRELQALQYTLEAAVICCSQEGQQHQVVASQIVRPTPPATLLGGAIKHQAGNQSSPKPPHN